MIYDILTAHATPGEYVFLVLVLAGAWMSGRSVANEWKAIGYIFVYALLLAAGARFLHFALYEAQFLSWMHYIVDLVPIAAMTWLGYQMTRTTQLAEKYYWIYEKVSPISVRKK